MRTVFEAVVFKNKKNNQYSIVLPKKTLKYVLTEEEPKKIKLKIVKVKF